MGLKKRDVGLVKGEKSGDKVFCIEEPNGLTVEKVIEKFRSNLE